MGTEFPLTLQIFYNRNFNFIQSHILIIFYRLLIFL
nr:MAG TPA: hypothetical protein [Caudoviricetes sp.]